MFFQRLLYDATSKSKEEENSKIPSYRKSFRVAIRLNEFARSLNMTWLAHWPFFSWEWNGKSPIAPLFKNVQIIFNGYRPKTFTFFSQHELLMHISWKCGKSITEEKRDTVFFVKDVYSSFNSNLQVKIW